MEIHCIYCVASPCLIWIIIIPFFHHLIYPQTSAPSMRAVGGDGDLLVWWQIRLGILLLQSIFWEFCEIHKKTWTFVTSCYFCSLNSPPPFEGIPCNPCNYKFFTLTSHPSWKSPILAVPGSCSNKGVKKKFNMADSLCKQQKRSMAPWSFTIQNSLWVSE